MTVRALCLAAAVIAILALPAQSQAPKAPPEAEKIGDDLYRVGKMTVDLKAKTATCSGKVNMQKGMVEYLAVAPQGKLHESVLNLEVRPLHLQVALILLGLEPKGGLRYQGDKQVPKGSPVDVFAAWERNGKKVRVPATEMVWDIVKKKPMDPAPWIFSGSMVTKEQGFVADVELSLIATFRDPAAIVNNALPSGADDTVYKVNERITPPWGTPVTVTLTPRASKV